VSDADSSKKGKKGNKNTTKEAPKKRKAQKTKSKEDDKKTGTQRPREKPSLFKRFKEVPRNEDGTPQLPVTIGPITVIALGTVVYNRPAFHSDKYIWPAGFKSYRQYASVGYTSEIIDDGTDAPKFSVTPDTDTTNPATGPSATAAWSAILKRINETKPTDSKRQHNSVSGPEYFGFAHPSILKLIQELPNAERCTKYDMQDFTASQGGSQENEEKDEAEKEVKKPPKKKAKTKEVKGEKEESEKDKGIKLKEEEKSKKVEEIKKPKTSKEKAEKSEKETHSDNSGSDEDFISFKKKDNPKSITTDDIKAPKKKENITEGEKSKSKDQDKSKEKDREKEKDRDREKEREKEREKR